MVISARRVATCGFIIAPAVSSGYSSSSRTSSAASGCDFRIPFRSLARSSSSSSRTMSAASSGSISLRTETARCSRISDTSSADCSESISETISETCSGAKRRSICRWVSTSRRERKTERIWGLVRRRVSSSSLSSSAPSAMLTKS